MDSMRNFQESVKIDLSQMKAKINEIEGQIVDLKINCGTKIDGEEVREIIDKKFNVLNEYRKDADNLSKKYNDITS